jgi:hypothetical protein
MPLLLVKVITVLLPINDLRITKRFVVSSCVATTGVVVATFLATFVIVSKFINLYYT